MEERFILFHKQCCLSKESLRHTSEVAIFDIRSKSKENRDAYEMIGASQVAQWVKNPPVIQETQETGVWSLAWEDPLEEEMTTHSSILAWRIP